MENGSSLLVSSLKSFSSGLLDKNTDHSTIKIHTMSSGSSALVQEPSRPDETSASKAFTQLPPNIAKAVAEFKSKGHKWTPDYKPGSEDEKIRAVFAAYATNDEPDNRDESQDPWKFEVCFGW